MSKRTLNRHTERQIVAWGRTALPGHALNDGGGLHLRRQSLDTNGKGRDYWFMRFTSPETGKRGWLAVWGDAALPYPQASTEEARSRAQAMREKLAGGVDPLASRHRESEVKRVTDLQAKLSQQRRLTVRQLFKRWQEVELTPHVRADGTRTGRKDGGAYTLAQFERHIFPTLGDMAAEDVSKGDVLAILDRLKALGKLRTCNVLLAEAKQMLRFAVAREVVPRSPLETLTKRDAGGAETGRDRVLSVDEVRMLAARLAGAGLHKRSDAAVWIILATGCRIGELMAAEWRHVDLIGCTWYLPDTKNERPHTIHLSALAVRQFEALQALREANPTTGAALPWLFPNAAGADTVCVKAFGKQLADRQRPPERRMKHRSKATESLMLTEGKWTAHDLRRTAATLMAGLGVSGDVIDECLNHVIESRVRRTYIRDRRPVEQGRAFDALGAKLDAIVSGTAPVSNVVPLDIVRAA